MGSSSNMYTPAVADQLRYMTQWFKEWSEMQRGDFLPILIQSFTNNESVNGLVTNMNDMCSIEDRRLSIFQCRIKLFKEWSERWSAEEKNQLLNDLQNIDDDFVNKYKEKLGGNDCGVDDIETLKTEHSTLNGNIEEQEEINEL